MNERRTACCTLPEPDLRARTAEIDAGLAKKIVAVRELDAGYALQFAAAPGIIEELGRFIQFERGCCSFLDFTLRVSREDGPVWLELTGSDDAKSFLQPVIARWSRSTTQDQSA